MLSTSVFSLAQVVTHHFRPMGTAINRVTLPESLAATRGVVPGRLAALGFAALAAGAALAVKNASVQQARR